MKFEKKFIIFSFFIFFILQTVFVLFINFNLYKEEKYFLKDEIKQYLEICSYKLNCKNVKVDFAKKGNKLFKLYDKKDSFYMFFGLPKFKKYDLKLTMDKIYYFHKLEKIKSKFLKYFLIELIVIIIFSFIFTFLLLIPLKKAYKINETFIKDILHDFNTPLSTLKLNLYLLQKEIGKNIRIEKIKSNIEAILNYQENLKNFIKFNDKNKEKFNIKELIDKKLEFYSKSYPNIEVINKANLTLFTNKTAINTILDNLISNAFKYSKEKGKIEIYIENQKLYIQDNGIGIKNPDKVFDRFYKENERGVGIGMSIVKRLCDELGIKIKVKSQEGTLIILDLEKITT